MPFIEDRYKQSRKWLHQAWSSKKQGLTREEFDNLYSIEAFDALGCIKWAFEATQKLNLI